MRSLTRVTSPRSTSPSRNRVNTRVIASAAAGARAASTKPLTMNTPPEKNGMKRASMP